MIKLRLKYVEGGVIYVNPDNIQSMTLEKETLMGDENYTQIVPISNSGVIAVIESPEEIIAAIQYAAEAKEAMRAQALYAAGLKNSI